MKKKLILAIIFLTAILLLAVPVFAQEEMARGVVTGSIINRSPGGPVPEKMALMLHAWDANLEEKLMLNGYSKTDGSFEFTNVTLDPNLQYAVMLTYDNVNYGSELVSVTEEQADLALEIPIYESTTDASSVRIDSLHILFDAALDSLQVAEIYSLSNTGSRTIVGQDSDEDAQLPSLQFPLPENATNISFSERSSSGRFLLAPGGFIDTAPLRPGDGTSQVVVTYALPYEDSLSYSWTAQWPVAKLSFMLASGIGLSLESENLTPAGTQDMAGGGQVDVFNHASLEADEKLAVSLSGTLSKPLAAPAGKSIPLAETEDGSSTKKRLGLGGVVLGFALVVAGIWWQSRPEPEEIAGAADEHEAGYDHLITKIAILDEAHQRGEVDGSEYERKREQMMNQIKVLLTKSPEYVSATVPSSK
jgi:hypothetical protein